MSPIFTMFYTDEGESNMCYLSEFQNHREFVCVPKRMALVWHILTYIHPQPCRILFRKNIAQAEKQPSYITNEQVLMEQKAIRDLFSPENLCLRTERDISYRRWIGDFGTEPSQITGWYEVTDDAHLAALFDLAPMSEFIFTKAVDDLSSYICQINYFERFEFGVALEIPENQKALSKSISTLIPIHPTR